MLPGHELQVLSWQQDANAAPTFDSIAPEQADIVRTALAIAGVPTVVLATCHRFEVYWAGASSQSQYVGDVVRYAAAGRLLGRPVSHQGERGLEHAMRVASGMQSLRRGEPEILGQMRQAWRASQDAGTSSRPLDQLMQRVIAASRHIRRHLGATAQWSIGDSTERLLRNELAAAELAHASTLLIVGAGAVGASVAEAIHNARHAGRLERLQSVRITNRTEHRAREVGDRFGAQVVAWDEWHDALLTADVVVTAARSTSPLIDRPLADRVMRTRRMPVVWVDLASPHNIAVDGVVDGCRVRTLLDLPGTDVFADAAAQRALGAELTRWRDERRRRERPRADPSAATSRAALRVGGQSS